MKKFQIGMYQQPMIKGVSAQINRGNSPNNPIKNLANQAQ